MTTDVTKPDRVPALALGNGPVARPPSVTSLLAAWAPQVGITVAFLAVWLTFIILAPDTFLETRIYVSFAQTTPYFALVALTLTMVITSGDIDLSFPSVMGLGVVGFVAVERGLGWSVWLAVLAALAVGALAGLLNGAVVTIIGVPALVVTIGTQFLYSGLTLVLVGGKSYPLVDARNSGFSDMLVGRIRDVPLLGRIDDVPLVGSVGGVPMQFVWCCLVAIGTWLLLYRHRIGQNAHVVGDNRHAAQLMGIPIRRTRILLFMLTGMAAALAGVMNALQVRNFYPSIGSGFLLPALAAVFVGGTSVFGGRGTVWGTFLGAFMIGGIKAGIVAVGLTEYYTEFIYGGIILVAVCIHALLQRRFEH